MLHTPSADVTVVVAAYNEQRQMLRSGTANISAGGRATVDVAVDLTDAASARAFLLDANNKPLTDALDLTLPPAA